MSKLKRNRATSARAAVLVSTLIVMLTGCGGGAKNDVVPTLNVEAAIDNTRTFDLAEIAERIEFIPLDDSRPEALVGVIRSMEGSANRFYIIDDHEGPVKVFDRRGRFLTTRGSVGRGPDELTEMGRMTLDRESDNLYLAEWGWGSGKMRGYNPDGEIIARQDSIRMVSFAFFEGRLVGVKQSYGSFSGDNDPTTGEMSVLLEILSPDLRPDGTIEAVEKGAPRVFLQGMVMTFNKAFISDNGETLIVKEFRSDTVYHLTDGERLRAAWVLDAGRYAIPPEVFGENATKEWSDDFHRINMVMEDNRYIFVETSSGQPAKSYTLVFDRDDPKGGFSAAGPEGEAGLFLDGIVFYPHFLHQGHLVGYVYAIDIVDAAEAGVITRPDLKALAATLQEDSNPVIVVAELKK